MGREARAKREARIGRGVASSDIPPPDLPTPEHPLARHEAAHAVVTHALGLRVLRITLDAAEAATAAAGRSCGRVDAATESECGTYIENAMHAVAGLAWRWPLELLAYDRTRRDGDIENWRQWCWKAAGGDAKKDRRTWADLLHRTYLDALRVLAERRAAWEALTQTLSARGRLDEADVLAILGHYPAVTPERLAERDAVRTEPGLRS